MDSNYKTNPMTEEFPELDQVTKRFRETGRLKPREQMWAYNSIAPWCTGKTVVDAGCGIGIGSYMVSHDAVGVFGFDNNPESIAAANAFYKGPRLTFEVVDLVKPLPRPMATADIVICMEVIEHVEDYETLLNTLKKFHDDRRRTVFFISTPNRAHPRLGKDQPKNHFHVREWTAGEFYQLMTKHFKHVTMYASDKPNVFNDGNLIDGDSQRSPILAKCESPIFQEGMVKP